MGMDKEKTKGGFGLLVFRIREIRVIRGWFPSSFPLIHQGEVKAKSAVFARLNRREDRRLSLREL
jgi:hypothetical protein